MNAKLTPGVWLTLFLAGALPASQQSGLRRVDPAQEQRQDDPSRIFARDFDRAEWEERLREPDLDQREKSYAMLLKRCRLDPVARAFLEELARDKSGGELSWTARLGLRELGRASFPIQGFQPGWDPFGTGERLEEMMRELLARDGSGLLLTPAFPGGPLSPNAQAGRAGAGSSGHSVHVEQTPAGARVEVHETIDGKDEKRVFEGPSLEEILRLNPELRQELSGLQIHVQPGSPMDLDFDLGRLQDPLLRGFLARRDAGQSLAPQARTRPVVTDKLGVVVHELSVQEARDLSLEGQGLFVERSYPETFAQLLGVVPGDVLLELDGVVLRTADDIELAMRARGADDELTLVWLDVLGQRQRKTWRPAEIPK